MIGAVTLVGICASWGAAAAQAASQAPAPDLRVGITGTVGPDVADRVHPTAQLRLEPVRRLAMAVAEAPRSEAFVAEALAGTELDASDLVMSGLIRERDGRYHLDFTLLTAADVDRVSAVTGRYGASLAGALAAHRHQIDPLIRELTPPGVPTSATAYIVIGCFLLDWLGLDLTSKEGYRTAARTHGNGHTYAVWAEERPSEALKGMYWGSHNEYGEGSVLTTFGDHHALPRHAFPDLLWRVQSATRRVEAGAAQPGLGLLAGDYLGDMAGDIGALMLALRYAGRTRDELGATLPGHRADQLAPILALLERLDYVSSDGDGRYHAAVPVLVAGDAPALGTLRTLTADIMASWLRDHYNPIRSELDDLTPVRRGVPYAEVFTQIWHDLFARATGALVDSGWLADPYARGQPGFIPAVWDPALGDAFRW